MAISCRESRSSRCFHSGDRIKVTNNTLSHRGFLACYAQSALAISLPLPVAVQTNNFRRLLRTVEALSELGPELTAEREFSETSRLMLSAIMDAAGPPHTARLRFTRKPP